MNHDTANSEPDLGAIFDAHIEHEFADQDVDATMLTMTAEPYVHNVPTLTGGFGGEGVRKFYIEEFVGKMPKDTQVIPVSRTVGKDQVVDELLDSGRIVCVSLLNELAHMIGMVLDHFFCHFDD